MVHRSRPNRAWPPPSPLRANTNREIDYGSDSESESEDEISKRNSTGSHIAWTHLLERLGPNASNPREIVDVRPFPSGPSPFPRTASPYPRPSTRRGPPVLPQNTCLGCLLYFRFMRWYFPLYHWPIETDLDGLFGALKSSLTLSCPHPFRVSPPQL
jgi:hypothetical protein